MVGGRAREAIERLTDVSGAIDVTVLDLRLPDSTGFGLLRQILTIAPACRVILITADGTPGILTQARDADAFSALAKPFDMHVIAGLVSQAAAG